MVSIATGLGRSGLQDWLLQRVTACVILGYIFYASCFFYFSKPIDYFIWHGFFSTPLVKLFSFLFVLSFLAHAWIGIWTVTTDYIKIVLLRLIVQLFFIATLLLQLVWMLNILWRFS